MFPPSVFSFSDLKSIESVLEFKIFLTLLYKSVTSWRNFKWSFNVYEFTLLLHNYMGNVRIQLCVFLQPLGFKVQCSILSIRRCFCCAVEERKFLVKFLRFAQMNRNVYLKLATWVSCCLVSELFIYIHTIWKINWLHCTIFST